ncbi:MAG: barstar family protein [Betaproteobacteria bacterium]|nr:barstar family protein [Betaproteobacteria bacterium]
MNAIPRQTSSVTDPAHAGVYRCKSSESQAALDAAHALRFTTASMELATANKGIVLESFASALRFPEWFGANWDALADCLMDLSWLDAPGYLIVLRSAPDIAARLGKDYATLIGVLEDAADFWRDEGRPFCILFENGHAPLKALPKAK